MLLEALRAENFRNLRGMIISGPGLNILTGENGAGKTNWLEAIDVLARARSWRTVRLTEAVKFGEKEGFAAGTVRESPEITRQMRIVISGNTKTLAVNDKKETVQRYLGQLHAEIFSHDELDIVRGMPDARRRYLDAGIVSLHPPFVQVLSDYTRVIKQKNALLQRARDDEYSLDQTREALIPWNEQLVKLSAKIHRSRHRFVERVSEVLEKHLFSREELTICYVSSLEGKGDMSDFTGLIAERLHLRVQAELSAGYSLIGPHRDDLELHFDGHDLRKFGSAGQQRSALILLKLANISVYNATRGEYPLFLIDDIDAELDYKRIGKLLDFLHGKTQTFVTTSKESFVQRFSSGAQIFHVTAGAAQMQ